jgi:polyisoprenoid-binding protein YceI
LKLSNPGSVTTLPGQAAVADINGTWTVGAGSQVGYRVGETLFGQRNTAVGRTSAVTGTMTIAGSTVRAGSFSADLTTVTSDRSQRDNQFQGRIMNTGTFPKATFSLSSPIAFNAPAVGATITEQATGSLMLHGTTKSVTFTLTARRDAASIEVVGSIPIVFAEWNIPNPSFAGIADTDDHGTLEFSLVLTHS